MYHVRAQDVDERAINVHYYYYYYDDDDLGDVHFFCRSQKMYLWWRSCTFYLHACHVRVTVGDLGLCCCSCVTSFEC